MKRSISTRIWIILGIGGSVVLGLTLLLVTLGQGPRQMGETPTPQPQDPVVATVYDQSIHYSFLIEAVLIDQVMTGLAGQPAPTPQETLDRLINEALVLRASPPPEEPTLDEVEAQIAALETVWNTDDGTVVTALEQVGLDRTAFERAVSRLLMVEIGLQAMTDRGIDTTAWLQDQLKSEEVQVVAEVAALPFPTVPPSTPPPPPANSPAVTPTSIPQPTQPPAPTVVLDLPEVAPDFTLERAGGEPVTLSEQLEEQPVVLVFFQRCG